MGFYGNITNTNKTQFTFDRTYPNRAAMDQRLSIDNIYLGRYVLIEYDLDIRETDEYFTRVYNLGSDKYPEMYTGPNKETSTRITIAETPGETSVTLNQVVFEYEDSSYPEDPRDHVQKFWICIGATEEGYADFKLISETDTTNNYTENYKIDIEKYGAGRAYDSTVWQKVFTDGSEKYVMIAELNSVVPTFDIAADAPTMTPLTPHFDVNSTNVYYKLHAQPQWGLRPKGISKEVETEVIKNTIGSESTIFKSSDKNNYPSDLKMKYEKAVYDKESGKVTVKTSEYDAAFYYNKAGFDPATRTRYDDSASGTGAGGDQIYSDEISILPTGYSGEKYSTHIPGKAPEEQIDTQEIKILLPSIGNMISDTWDIIYGHGKKVLPGGIIDDSTDENNNIRYRDCGWKFVEDLENPDLGGMTRDINTFVGCINTVHDLIGMIVTNEEAIENSEEEYNKKYIYRKVDENGNIVYSRLVKIPTYQVVDISEFKTNYENWQNTDYPSTQEKNAAYDDLFETFTEENYYIQKENGEYQFINIRALPQYKDKYTIYTDAAFTYKEIVLQGLENHFVNILRSLIECRDLLGTDIPETTDKTTVQGALNALNAIIDKFKNMNPGEFTYVDENGELISMNWTTKQEFNWTNYGNNTQGSTPEVENRYIDLSFNFDDKEINLTHAKSNRGEVQNTVTTSNKNDSQNINSTTNNQKNHTDVLDLYTPIVDEMGHIIGNNTETVTLPYGYKFFETTGLNNNDTEDLYTSITNNENGSFDSEISAAPSAMQAKETKDTMVINPGNKWIQTKIDNENDSLVIAHEIHGINKVQKEKTDLNNNIDEITLQDIEVDVAGHIIANQQHTYTLPYGYKTIKTNGRNINETNLNQDNVPVTQTSASNTQDLLNINSGNYWIRNDITNDNITISHSVRDIDITPDVNIDLNTDKNTLSIPTWTYDKAGHIRSKKEQIITLPYGYKHFKDVETPTAGSSTAISTYDTFTFKGDSWVKPQVSQGMLTINHIGPVGETITPKDNITLKFGDSFALEDHYYDEKGHKYDTREHTVTIPQGSLIDSKSNGADVITQLALNKTSGELSTTRTNIGALKLTDYVAGDNATDIAATDTLIQALSKLQKQINDEENARATAIRNLLGEGNINEAFNTIQEIATWLETNDTNADKVIDSFVALDGRVTQLENVGSQKNVQSNWTETNTSSDAYILNKPEGIITENTEFEYEAAVEEVVDPTTGEIITEGKDAINITIFGLIQKIKDLEAKINI